MLELAICDDDIILCNWLEQKLLHYGKANDCQISIEIYYSAEQLLNRLEEESYDMLFLDICLEHENGIDIGTEIRKKNYGKELRITYISTYQEYEYRGKLKDVADVTEEYFLLIHKSYLINMEHVEHYEYDNVVMKDKTRLSISKANRKKVRERLLQTEKKRL